MDVDERTIDRYLSSHAEEIKTNGYHVLKGKALKNFKLAYVDDTDVVDIIDPKIPSLGVFTFRAMLNLAMLITESSRAKVIRSRLLDIVIDVVAEKAGGHTKYINQRDQDYLPAAYMEDSYRKQFTDALRDCLNMGNYKYAVYTDKIYQAVFCENALEYKKVLKLADKDNTRNTMYAEVLKAIASFEHGLAAQMSSKSKDLGRKLNPSELDNMIAEAENNPFLQPSIEDARIRMASRDLGFRDGNKRSSLSLGAYFLELNGYDYCVTKFIIEMENIVVWLAENKISKDLLLKLITSLIMDDDYSEELKIELLEVVDR